MYIFYHHHCNIIAHIKISGYHNLFVRKFLPIYIAHKQLPNLRQRPNSPVEDAHQDESNDTLLPICEFQVGFLSLWIKAELKGS